MVRSERSRWTDLSDHDGPKPALNPATVVARLEERHLTHADLADALRLSRSYWSQLVHRKRALSPQVRRALLAAPALAGLSETELWDRLPSGAQP